MRTLDTTRRRASRGRERDLQQQIRASLSHLGYESLETGVAKRRVRCKACMAEFTPEGGNNAPGVPDLLVFRQGWPKGAMLGIEVKGESTRVSPRQQELSEGGRIVIVRSIIEALLAVRDVEADQECRADAPGTSRCARINDYLAMNEGRLG